MFKIPYRPEVYQKRLDMLLEQNLRTAQLRKSRKSSIIYGVASLIVYLHTLFASNEMWWVTYFAEKALLYFLLFLFGGYVAAAFMLHFKIRNIALTRAQADLLPFDNTFDQLSIINEEKVRQQQERERRARIIRDLDKFHIRNPQQLRNKYPVYISSGKRKPKQQEPKFSYFGMPEELASTDEYVEFLNEKRENERKELKLQEYKEQLRLEYMHLPRYKVDYSRPAIYRLGTIDDLLPTQPKITENLNDETISQVRNLREWLSGHVLKHVVCRFDCLNDCLRSYGFFHVLDTMSVGELELLATDHVFQQRFLPYIVLIKQYLNPFNAQPYVVSRIRQLARGVCLEVFNDNIDFLRERKNAGYVLPNDTAIIFHLFCTFMDTHLQKSIQSDERRFYDGYVVMPCTSDRQEIHQCLVGRKFGIFCTNLIEPQFNFVLDSQLVNNQCTEDVFLVLVLFLKHVRKYLNGMLDGVDLGGYGVDILVIFNDI